MSLTRRARELYPTNRRLAAKYVLAARALKAQGKSVHHGFTPTWKAVERRAKDRPPGYAVWPRTAREFISQPLIDARGLRQ